MISLNKDDGSFAITDLARDILWSKRIPTWARILRLLQIKSCSVEEISDILRMSKEELYPEIEKLRKSQLVLMSPQRLNEKIVKIFEILSEGIEAIDRTETDGFDEIEFGKGTSETGILESVDEIIQKIQDVTFEQRKKDDIVEKLTELKNRLKI